MSDAALSAARRAALTDPAERAAYLARYARVHSPADVLRERVRVGDLRADWLELAARLAHPVAREVHPRTRLVDWTSWSERREVLRPLMESDRCLVVSWLVDGAERALGHAERVLPVYESHRPGDSRPRRAIKAGRDLCAVLRLWVQGEATGGDVSAARCAAYTAYAAAGADAGAEADAANAADASTSAAYAAYAVAVAVADAAAASAASASTSSSAAADAAAYAAAVAAADPASAYATSETRDAEHAWRRDRLALYLLGEVEA